MSASAPTVHLLTLRGECAPTAAASYGVVRYLKAYLAARHDPDALRDLYDASGLDGQSYRAHTFSSDKEKADFVAGYAWAKAILTKPDDMGCAFVIDGDSVY